MKMQGKVVLITGASSGIGKAMAEVFGREGASLCLMARNTERLEQLVGSLESRGVRSFAITGDVSKEQDCKRFVDESYGRYGRIDVLINNAGQSMRALFEQTELSVLKQLMDINFWGAVYCTKFALPHLLAVKGSVVGVSSIAGKKGLPGRTGYSASKFAMEGFMETLRTENLKKGLHVLVACPGFTSSNIRQSALSADGSVQGESPRDEHKMMTAGEVAERILSAVNSRKRDIVMTTNGKLAVWLNRFFPSW
ncbi:MAG: SDR family oxidoreductase, partial [Bacteroidota bacterium]